MSQRQWSNSDAERGAVVFRESFKLVPKTVTNPLSCWIPPAQLTCWMAVTGVRGSTRNRSSCKMARSHARLAPCDSGGTTNR